MAKIAILGCNGQVGFELVRTLGATMDLLLPSRSEIDLSELDTIDSYLARTRPDVVINAAADTAVDRAETQMEPAATVNALAPAQLAQSCKVIGARLIHFSTDYVFNGTKGEPYTEEDPTEPVNQYGIWKLAGEDVVLSASVRNLVFRLSWVYASRGKNFALTMLRLAREAKPIRVVADQTGTPSYAPHIADCVGAIADRLLVEDAEGGLFHLTARGETTWHGFAEKLLDTALGEEAPVIEPIPSEAFPTPAARPRYSVLNSEKALRRFDVAMPRWEDGVSAWAESLS